MFYYTDDEYIHHVSNYDILDYSERTFDTLLNWQYDEDGNSVKPFRDEYSIRFLKDTWNMEFVSEDDWYSIQSPEEGRFSLSGLSRAMKYALTLLHYSRKGSILSFRICSEKIWKVLDTMPFDILVAMNISKIKNFHYTLLGIDYVIENFPFHNRVLQVQIGYMYTKNNGYEEVEKHKGVALYQKDGKYFINAIYVDDYFCQFRWQKYIKEIVSHAEFCIRTEKTLMEKKLVNGYVDFMHLLGIEEDDAFRGYNDYYYYLSFFTDLLKNKEITQSEYDVLLLEEQKKNDKSFQEYLWLINDLQIISYLYIVPYIEYFNSFPMLIVDKYPNGSYKIWSEGLHKVRNFEDVLQEMVFDKYTENCIRYITVVNMGVVFQSVEDIKYTACGFKITKNCIEIFDKNEALKTFHHIATEALNSKECEVCEDAWLKQLEAIHNEHF